jgi:hypothetical protein
MLKSFKNQYNPFLYLSYVIVIMSLLTTYVDKMFLYVMIGASIVGLSIYAYKIIKRSKVGILDIFGLIFLLLYTLCVLLIPSFDMLLFLFSCLLLISMMVCMHRCKDEDAKSIALLHVIYMFGCNLVMPCIGPAI